MLTKKMSLKALVSAIVVVLCAGLMSSCSFSSKKTIYAQFTTAAGLFVGNQVGVLGVPVGTITDVTPEGKYVVVKMEIDQDQPIPANATAVVVSRSVATDRYVELTPVFQGDMQQIADGATIGVDRTQTPVEFDQVLSTIGTFADQISGPGPDKDAIKRFLTAQSNALAGRGDLINQAIKSLGAAVDGVSQQRGNATSTLVSLDGLTSKLAANQQTIREFVMQVSKATSLLAAERNNFRDAVSSATTMINTVAQFAKDNRAQITRAVTQTNDVLKTLNSKAPQVAEILKLLPLATENIQRAVQPDNRIVVRLDLTSLVPVLGSVLQGICSQTANLSLCQSIGLGSVQDIPGTLANILKGLGGN